jgi:hypothetical protein
MVVELSHSSRVVVDDGCLAPFVARCTAAVNTRATSASLNIVLKPRMQARVKPA